LFGEDAAKGEVMGIVTGTITDKKHIGYPCVDYSSLSGTICSVKNRLTMHDSLTLSRSHASSLCIFFTQELANLLHDVH
jgi:hypothetical protein